VYFPSALGAHKRCVVAGHTLGFGVGRVFGDAVVFTHVQDKIEFVLNSLVKESVINFVTIETYESSS